MRHLSRCCELLPLLRVHGLCAVLCANLLQMSTNNEHKYYTSFCMRSSSRPRKVPLAVRILRKESEGGNGIQERSNPHPSSTMTRFCIAADAPVTSPAGVRTRNRRALSSIQVFSPCRARCLVYCRICCHVCTHASLGRAERLARSCCAPTRRGPLTRALRIEIERGERRVVYCTTNHSLYLG